MSLTSLPPRVEQPAVRAEAAGSAPIEVLTLPVDGLGRHDLLRAFERLRVKLSERLRGSPGCFTGYNRLVFTPEQMPTDARLECIVVVMRATGDRLELGFEALVKPLDSHRDAPSRHTIRIAWGEGCVVAF